MAPDPISVLMSDDAWAALADPFVEGTDATVKGRVRTFVLHQQLLRHLPEASRRDPSRPAPPS